MKKRALQTLNTFDNVESRTPIIVLEGNGSRPSHMGNGYSDCGTMYTLNTIEQHSVCFQKSFNHLNPLLMENDK